MRGKMVILWLVVVLAAVSCGQEAVPVEKIENDAVSVHLQQQYESITPGGRSAIAVHFELKNNWHFYAPGYSATAEMQLQITPSTQNHITFSEPIFPQSQVYLDKSLGKSVRVFSGNFTVLLPFTAGEQSTDTIMMIGVEGVMCSDMQCRMPDIEGLGTTVKISADVATEKPRFVLPQATTKTGDIYASQSWQYYLMLAFLAGVILNVMPCVLPVIPLKVLSIFEQAKESKSRCIAMGLSFCLGIILFFATLAILNIVLQVGYGTVFQWGDHFRHPIFVIGMSLLMLLLALFMFDVFTIGLPSSIVGKAGGGKKGYSGSVAMGFLAAVMSTPCSFAILAAAFAWAQTQRLPLATTAIMLIGVGMAAPYAILTAMPGLLKYLPKPGRWSELFKQTMGFVLLGVAMWLAMALPVGRTSAVLYFGVILAFCMWMWGRWVDFNTSRGRKWVIRIIAVVVAVGAGMLLLPEGKGELIDWQQYDAEMVEKMVEEQRPILINFTAKWCANCKLLEKTVFKRKDIAELILRKNVAAIKADTSLKDAQATIDLKGKFNEPGTVPVTILIVPAREEPVKLPGFAIGTELKELLEALADKGL